MTILTLITTYPIRVRRFVFHFLQWMPIIRKSHLSSGGITEWLIDFSFYVADLLMIPDFMEFIFVWIQPQIRRLNKTEKGYASKYFKNKIAIDNIRIGYSIPQQIQNLAIAFVTFNTIHYSEKISLPIFIHEMVHIWQYQRFGSVYIFRALKAQRSVEGYDYGGLENLYTKMLNNHSFSDFNFEQQGEIFEDYCRMQESEINKNAIAEASYKYFIRQVQEGEIV